MNTSNMAEHPDTGDSSLIEMRLDGKAVYSGAFLTVKRDCVRLPDGKTAMREYIDHPGVVMVIPLFDDNRVLMERQYRYPLGKVIIEFPAGKLDQGENTRLCARRELREETGYSARELIYLTRVHPMSGSSNEFIELFIARGLEAGAPQRDEGEFLTTFVTDVDQLLDWVKSGHISDMKTVVGVFWLEKILSGKWG